MRTIIIGDVHGCAASLQAIWEKTAPSPDDQVILLGDLFDRGPDSYGVFQLVKKYAAELGERLVLLRGNHEDYLLQPRLSMQQRLVWDRVGRGATVKSFRAHGGRMEDAIPWLQARCQLFWRGEGVQCVHAGLLIEPLEMNDTHTLIHDHGVVYRNRYHGPLTVVGHIALDAPTYFAGDGETEEVLPLDTALTLPERGVICIDTGCGKGGFLTAMTVENGRFRLDAVNGE